MASLLCSGASPVPRLWRPLRADHAPPNPVPARASPLERTAPTCFLSRAGAVPCAELSMLVSCDSIPPVKEVQEDAEWTCGRGLTESRERGSRCTSFHSRAHCGLVLAAGAEWFPYSGPVRQQPRKSTLMAGSPGLRRRNDTTFTEVLVRTMHYCCTGLLVL